MKHSAVSGLYSIKRNVCGVSVFLLLLSIICIGCSSGGGSSASVGVPADGASDNAPAALTYAYTSAIYTKDMAITENMPAVSGTVSTWSVSPDLPAGLTLDTDTGTLTGTPTVEQSAAVYTITAANAVGSTTAAVLIAVNDKAPASLRYSSQSVVYTIDETISANKPSVNGTVSTWSVSPDLPAGLTLDTDTGIITGCPTAAQTASNYVITAENSRGTTTSTLSITVNSAAPASLSYSHPVAVYTVNGVIAENTPLVTGTVTEWSVSPNLPAGLTLNTLTGSITGIATTEQAAAEYTITAKNSFGTTTAVLSITVNNDAPASLSYSAATAAYTFAAAVTENKPSVNGTVSAWSVTPALPQGLILNTTTGIISGTPELEQAACDYVITAANTHGSTTATISIAVNSTAPTNLVYTPSTVVLGEIIYYKPYVYLPRRYIFSPFAITVTPAYSGTVTSWSIDKTLPTGLTFDTSTGIISGTTTAFSNYTGIAYYSISYTITAANSGGSVSTTVTTVGPY